MNAIEPDPSPRETRRTRSGKPPGFTRPPSQLAIAPGVIADARRALWIPGQQALLIADVHLGFAWVSRQRGLLLPLSPEDTLQRLLSLVTAYRPRECVFLGDTVHAAASLAELTGELHRLVVSLSSRCSLRFVLGNHDHQLPRLLQRAGLNLPCAERMSCGDHLLVHGDTAPPAGGSGSGWLFQGHEHPAVAIGDGITTRWKVPCFLIGNRRVILPAFSSWAAGQAWRGRARGESGGDGFHAALAILGDRLLRVDL